MTRIARTIALAAATAAAFAPAATAGFSLTAAQEAARLKQDGITFSDGSHARVINGFCDGAGRITGGTIATPRYARFTCTLFTGTYGNSQLITIAVGTTGVRVLDRS